MQLFPYHLEHLVLTALKSLVLKNRNLQLKKREVFYFVVISIMAPANQAIQRQLH